ncbi:MAG: hypothetical protein HOP08_02175 [Cyclobacteriaceae bacterium]|nr:hypothetical protein [Cyclobacteriaceae bacterium]
MKKSILVFAIACGLMVSGHSYAQDSSRHKIRTIFRPGTSSGGYGALSNKFTTIRGQYANIAEVYGGWYVNHWFMIGLSAAAVTNNLPVPIENSADPSLNLSYQYGQFGLMTEYVIGSGRAVHLAFSLFAGPGFTLQYQRYDFNNNNNRERHIRDENWFFVAEPGMHLEFNVLKWMRFSPGISYRATAGSNASGLSDSDLSNLSYNATLKFGRF